MTTSFVFVSGAGADDIKIPDMGSPADAILNKYMEAQIGRAIMHSIRNSGVVVEDPQINEYINDIGHRIAAQTNDGDHDFTFFVVQDERINAFALPGGYIGVHTGLIDATRNEHELAGVIAHEIAHVTQRHIAPVQVRGQHIDPGERFHKAGSAHPDPDNPFDIARVQTDTRFVQNIENSCQLRADLGGQPNSLALPA